MEPAWLITVGGGVIGVGGLMLRDYFLWRRAQGLPLFWPQKISRPLWISFAVFLVVFFTGLVLPVLARPRATCCRINSTASNMNQLLKAMYMYADDNSGKFPSGGATPIDSLWLLYPEYVSDPRCFYKPYESSKWPSNNVALSSRKNGPRVADEFRGTTAYYYCESVTDSMSIVLFERTPRNGGRHVAYASGTVEWMTEPEFLAAWQKQQNPPPDSATSSPAIPAAQLSSDR